MSDFLLILHFPYFVYIRVSIKMEYIGAHFLILSRKNILFLKMLRNLSNNIFLHNILHFFHVHSYIIYTCISSDKMIKKIFIFSPLQNLQLQQYNLVTQEPYNVKVNTNWEHACINGWIVTFMLLHIMGQPHIHMNMKKNVTKVGRIVCGTQCKRWILYTEF